MDRNIINKYSFCHRSEVALRKESVDRNVYYKVYKPSETVALRKESVDRNPLIILYALEGVLSLSARRAWIEIYDT